MNQKLYKKTYWDEKTGYFRFKDSNKLVHRWVVETKIIKRPLKRGEMVHHLNGDKRDNREENLKVVNFLDHIKIHYGPAIKAEGNAELLEQIIPVLDSYEIEREERDLKAMFTGIALVGIIMFVLGLINPTKLDLWFVGLGLFIVGVVSWLVNRSANK